MISIAPVCWPVAYYLELAFETGKEQVISVIETDLFFMQCSILIHIRSND